MRGEHVFERGVVDLITEIADVELLTHGTIPFRRKRRPCRSFPGRKERDQSGGPPSRDGERNYGRPNQQMSRGPKLESANQMA